MVTLSDKLNGVWINFVHVFQKNPLKSLSYTVASSILVYLITPSIFNLVFRKSVSNERSERKDKYTTGLVNTSTECYANSSVQVLASLSNFTIYLNKVISIFELELKIEKVEKDAKEAFDTYLYKVIPVHYALCQLLADLQELIDRPRERSVSNFIRILEASIHKRITGGQQDANELTQIVLEVLQNELESLKKYVNRMELSIEVPRFPFEGKLASYLSCLNCGQTSIPNISTFNILPIQTPQEYSAELEEIIYGNQIDQITDYSCLVCQTNAILKNEKTNGHKGNTTDEHEIVKYLEDVLPVLRINEELDSKTLNYIKYYNKYGMKSGNIKSTIIKKNSIIETPKILMIHLSRSIYNGMVAVRNSCRVRFEEKMSIERQTTDEKNENLKIELVDYQLQSIIKHTGTHNSGHYQCYRRKPNLKRNITTKEIINFSPVISPVISSSSLQNSKKDNRKLKSINKYPFWKISDTKINESTLDNVTDKQKSVYILFYEMIT
ncbi:hypothetical protein Kpol_1024p44 [Vanderwaltozyma polyspora DSM 70294]|uniref:USP domain-containing protein n=1 Tax=Vanderwaltozyma polyspora (strain ATCC 22028 / DSM 70294 / BCRC 21397 / CBS 2163 / NBRC 10782 / NRRL Y-8283 / UCD 57-17) TaxID=436907 RepID=A7TLK4_VANPO|nr:uncharacterized protein Kpol_1024p44 [Vanderwaltozyma polyspora DSM 70294]EDO16890.1 hypothetical protein Kpol_1024p44 [Vanderwaltozyma polyspora DSM 70294]